MGDLTVKAQHIVQVTAELPDGQELVLEAGIATDALGLPYVVFDGVAYTPAVAQTVARLLNEAVSMLLAESTD